MCVGPSYKFKHSRINYIVILVRAHIINVNFFFEGLLKFFFLKPDLIMQISGFFSLTYQIVLVLCLLLKKNLTSSGLILFSLSLKNSHLLLCICVCMKVEFTIIIN
jgi:hypothetical protein